MFYRYRLGNFGIDIKGVEICKILSAKPQTLDEITDQMLCCFPGSNRNTLISEIENYLHDLENDNLIVSGSSDEELKKKDAVKTSNHIQHGNI